MQKPKTLLIAKGLLLYSNKFPVDTKAILMEQHNIYIDGDYKTKHPNWHREDSEDKATVIIEAMTKAGIAPQSVMEIGCGAGGILDALHQKMADSVTFKGFEISPQAFEFCQGLQKDRLDFSNEDVLLSEPAGQFDVVLCIDVFEHVENYIDFIRKLKQLGEYKIFRIPLDLSARSVLRNNYWGSREKYGHIHYFTKELILQVLVDLDYSIVNVFFDPIPLQQIPESPKAYLLYLLNRLAYKISPDFAARALGGNYFLMVTAK
jgi:SAM-dependent methyltransferase